MKKIKFFLLFVEKPLTNGLFSFAIVVGGIGLPLLIMASQNIHGIQSATDTLYHYGYIIGGTVLFFSLLYQVYKFRKTNTFEYGLFGDPDQTCPF